MVGALGVLISLLLAIGILVFDGELDWCTLHHINELGAI